MYMYAGVAGAARPGMSICICMQALLWQPAMLGPLGEMRRRLQLAASEAACLKEQLSGIGQGTDGGALP